MFQELVYDADPRTHDRKFEIMTKSRSDIFTLVTLCICVSCVHAQDPNPTPSKTPATQPADLVRFPGVTIDLAAKQVRVECQALAIDAPLEFFCVTAGGPEHESVLRSPAKPSHIHAGLLLLGQQPGSPMKYSETKKAWSKPFGPPIRVSVEFKNAAGELVKLPATSLLRHVRSHEPMKAISWIFAGSHQREDGAYLADLTGYVVSLVNFEHTLIDVPQLVSASNETLEWETNPEVKLERGQAVTMILEPLQGPLSDAPTTRSLPGNVRDDASATVEMQSGSDAAPIDDAEIADLRKKWESAVAPHQQALKDAAQTHYEVIAELRRKQQALVDEADKLQRLIDELEKQYAEMTTPKPE